MPSKKVLFEKPSPKFGTRIVLYGTGGIGKTTLASYAPGQVVFFDLDQSLGTLGIDCPVVAVDSWSSLRAALKPEWPDSVKTIVVDSITVAEEMCIRHVLDTVKVSGQKAESLEDYGFGKDIRYVYEAFILLLSDLEIHFKAGRNIILIAHEAKPEETNPSGQNYIRFEPRLRSSKKGENSIRLKIKEWADFVGFLSYDIAVGKDKKAQGSGTRTLHLSEMPWFMAKNRGCQGPISIEEGKEADVWAEIIK